MNLSHCCGYTQFLESEPISQIDSSFPLSYLSLYTPLSLSITLKQRQELLKINHTRRNFLQSGPKCPSRERNSGSEDPTVIYVSNQCDVPSLISNNLNRLFYISDTLDLSTFLFISLDNSPPRFTKQPPTDEVLFKVAQVGKESDKQFVIECEADGEPEPE